MKTHHFILFVISLFACQNRAIRQEVLHPSAEECYRNAGKLMLEMKYDSALISLRQAFDRGFEHPMSLIRDSRFYYLIDHPEYRAKVRDLLKVYAIETTATMIRDEEPGTRLSVSGQIRDETDGKPLENVAVEIVHADSSGLYFDEPSMFNPRLFAYLKTDAEGRFAIHSVRPGSYPDDEGNPVPAHMHFTLEKKGFKVYASEFTFEDDPIFIAKGNVDSVPVATRQAKDSPYEYEVNIYLQRE